MGSRVRKHDLLLEYQQLSREAFAEKYSQVAFLLGIGKAKDVSEEEEFEGRTMMVTVGSSAEYPSLHGEEQAESTIEAVKGSLTDIVWLIPQVGRVLTLGRDKRADISIPEYSVSAEHSWLAWKRGKGLTIEDNAASNGVWIESELLKRLLPGERYIFEGNELVMLGRFVFRFLYFDSLVMMLAQEMARAQTTQRPLKKSKGKKEPGGFLKRFFWR